MSYKSFRLLLMFLIVFFGLFFIKYVSAQACCDNGDQCLTQPDSASCGSIDNIILDAGSCTMAPELCVYGCCCIEPDNQPWSVGKTKTIFNSCMNDRLTMTSGTTVFYPGVIGDACNAGYCHSNPPDKFKVEGFIFDANNNPVQGATVHTPNNSIFMSQLNGAYHFNDILSTSSITISANNSDCQGSVVVKNVNSDKSGENIVLECCQTVQYDWGPCDPVTQIRQRVVNKICAGILTQTVESETCQIQVPCQWNCTWSPPTCPTSDGYRYSTCKEIPAGCTIHIAPPPLKERCPEENPNCNHDGIVDESIGEKCDYNYTTGAFNSNCDYPYNNSRSSCDESTCQCIPHTPAKTGCEADPGNLSGLLLSQVFKEKAFLLDWQTTKDLCKNYIDHFELRRCINISGDCNFNVNINTNIDKTLKEYKDNKTIPRIQPNKNYCYNLTEVFNNSITNITLKRSSIVECIDSGNLTCMQDHPDKWCDKNPNPPYRPNTIVNCSKDNILQGETCQDNQYCTESAGDASCVEQGRCDVCNNVFAVFGNQLFSGSNKVFAELNDVGEEVDQLCPTILDPMPIPTQDNELGGCFLDYSRSTYDAAYYCNETNTCYDYSSPSACKDDYCDKFTINGVNTCQWAPYNIDFNKGVCRPKDPDYRPVQNCTLCTVEDHNRIYPDCAKDVCPLYGYCYFKSSDSKCVSGLTIYCSNFQTQDECIGPSGQSSSVLVDVGKTNKLLSASNDILNIGRCRWLGPSAAPGSTPCIKDADNNSIDDCVNTKLPTDQRRICEHDVTPPVTTINNRSVYSLMMDLSDMYITDDGPWIIGDDTKKGKNGNGKIDYTKLLYCIAPDNTPDNSIPSCYPTHNLNTTLMSNNRYLANLSEFYNQYGKKIDAQNSNGYGFRFYYFSEDPAKNLEQVRSFNFTLDAKPPKMTLTKIFNSFPQGPTWKTNLTFIIMLDEEDNRPVDCSFKLRPAMASTVDFSGLEDYDIGSSINLNNYQIFSVGKSLNTTYPYLPEGYYDYDLDCSDVAGNIYHENATIKVEGDLRMNSALPALSTYRSIPGLESLSAPENMTLHTTGPGTCKYSDTETAYVNMTKSFSVQKISDDDYLHTVRLDIRNVNPSGIYRYYTACNLTINGIPQIVTGDEVDWIYFAIDDLSPQTQLLNVPNSDNSDSDTLEPYNASKSSDYLKLMLLCNDSAYQLIEHYNNGNNKDINYSMSFGCDPSSTHYCIRRADTPGMCKDMNDTVQFKPYYGSAIPLDYTDENASLDKAQYGNSPYFCYYSADNGLNVEGVASGYGTAYGTPVCTRLNISNGVFHSPIINISAGD